MYLKLKRGNEDAPRAVVKPGYFVDGYTYSWVSIGSTYLSCLSFRSDMEVHI